MKKLKYFIMVFFVLTLLFLIPNASNAAVEYTRTIPSNDGTIKLNFTGLDLDMNEAYEFALVKQGGTPQNWFNIDDGYTTTTATITLSSSITKISDVLKVTDTGVIYIRKQNDATNSYILEAYQVNLKLPYLQSLAYREG